jgi:predicted 3-demethylubiquinone-9 3-methyltransferase (glyoxalase superfamily)
MCIDAPVKQPFTFTPAMSLVVERTSEAELDTLFADLSDGGQILVPLDAYPFSKRFGWLTDRYGVSAPGRSDLVGVGSPATATATN